MRAANATHSNAVPTIFRHVAFICVFIAFIVLFVLTCVMPPNLKQCIPQAAASKRRFVWEVARRAAGYTAVELSR